MLDAFDAIADGRQSCHASTCSRLTFGIRAPDAGGLIRLLRDRLEELNPPGMWGGHRWEIRAAPGERAARQLNRGAHRMGT